MNKAAKIFLSHSSKDKDFVRRLANDLKSNGVPVWFDEWELKVGDSLNLMIGLGIKESSWLAVIISKNSNKSAWVDKELNAGLSTELEKKQVYVLPIVIEDCEIPIFLRDKVFADFRHDYQIGLHSLLKRLIPEKPTPRLISDNSLQINTNNQTQRQTDSPNPEDLLLKITDVRIEGKDPQYPALLVVRFKLDKTPDQDWCDLFEHPTTWISSIHPAKVYDNEIEWQASEEDIRSKRQWIYDWLVDANKRYLPMIQARIIKQEERFRLSQLENAKLASLENLLKSGQEGVPINLSDEIMVGKCSLRLENCAAPNIPGPITQVNFPNKGHIHVCFNCLQKQIDERHWEEQKR